MRVFRELYSAVLLLSTVNAIAATDELGGTWKFSKSAVYFSKAGLPPQPAYHTLQIVNGQVWLDPMCGVPTVYSKEPYDYSEFFQMAIQGGAEEKDMAKYVQKNFGFNLTSAKDFYVGGKLTQHCAIGLGNIFATKDKLIFAGPGGSFNSFDRSNGGVPVSLDPVINLHGKKLSHLPYRSNMFNVLCADIIPRVKNVRQKTDKCGPVFYPYFATKNDADPLSRLIGTHTYRKMGRTASKDYDNPVSNNLNPVYMLLPPFKDVMIVAVEDLEISDSRPGMGAVYRAIMNNKVADQISANCILSEDYSCIDGEGKKIYQLRGSGKFEKLPR